MNQEDKLKEFMKTANDTKATQQDLHKSLMEQCIVPIQSNLSKESIKHFYETGTISGGLFLALIDYAEKYAAIKIESIPVFHKCHRCNGTGRVQEKYNVDGECNECRGKGFKTKR